MAELRIAFISTFVTAATPTLGRYLPSRPAESFPEIDLPTWVSYFKPAFAISYLSRPGEQIAFISEKYFSLIFIVDLL